MIAASFQFRVGKRGFGQNHRHRRHGLGRLEDLSVSEGQGHGAHLLTGKVIDMKTPLATAKLTQLLLAVPDRQSGNGGAKKLLFALTIGSVTGRTDLRVDA